jgi:flagellar hook-associated protein 1 FlgK
MANINALNSALSGLKVAQNNIGLISNNISNVNTEGYTRKTQGQSTLVSDNLGQGVLANNVQRTVDAFLQRELIDQRAVAAGLETKQTYFQQIQDFHGAAEDENALSNQIGRLKDSFAALSNDPSKDYLLNDVYVQARETVNKVHDFNDLLTRLRNDSQNEMKQIVDQINTLTGQIEDLNLQIKSQANVGRTTADLEDQRDIAVAQLSENLDISYFERSDKVLVVQTNRGTPLVEDKARELFFNPEPI